LPCFSQGSSTKINPAKSLCFPDSTIRKAAKILVQYKALQREVELDNKSIEILGDIIYYKDSIIYENGLIIKSSSDRIKATEGLLVVSKSETAAMQKKYKDLKFNDRTKIGIIGIIVIALAYAYIQK
jgi:hypothetical protein